MPKERPGLIANEVGFLGRTALTFYTLKIGFFTIGRTARKCFRLNSVSLSQNENF